MTETVSGVDHAEDTGLRYSHLLSVALSTPHIDWPVVARSCQGAGCAAIIPPGLELAELFYAEVVAPIMEDALAGVPYSAALIGWGSEVQGFDTQRSTDHAWGLRMQLFLGHNDFLARVNDLDAVLDHALPAEFRGYPSVSLSRRVHRPGTGYRSRTCGTSSSSSSARTQTAVSRPPPG